MSYDLDRYLNLACQAAKMAGELLKSEFAGERTIEYKGVIDPVTEVDKASERMLVEFFRTQTPEADILAEEEAKTLTGRELCWVIDPLDGTVNYAHKIPMYCVSVGLEAKGEVIVGAVYDPERDELFAASKDLPATLNGREISVSNNPDLGLSVLATGFPYDKRTNPENNLAHFSEMALATQGSRRFGSAALDLCWTAAGRFDGYWELALSPWDICAGRLIVAQAGGKVTDFTGEAINSNTAYILATNGLIHDDVMAVLARNHLNTR